VRFTDSLDLADEKSTKRFDVALAAVVFSIVGDVRLGWRAEGAVVRFEVLAPPSGRRDVVVLLRSLTMQAASLRRVW
jgi:hypothetical protein